MMSQLSSLVQDPNWISIPFAKFSHNTSPYGTRNFIWSHVSQRNDLDLIVRNDRVVDEYGNYSNRVVLKITAGMDVLVGVSWPARVCLLLDLTFSLRKPKIWGSSSILLANLTLLQALNSQSKL
jgi:hypothetical protein